MSDEENCGLVCCWSLKNPEVKESITSVCTTIPVHVSTLIDMTCTSSVLCVWMYAFIPSLSVVS